MREVRSGPARRRDRRRPTTVGRAAARRRASASACTVDVLHNARGGDSKGQVTLTAAAGLDGGAGARSRSRSRGPASARPTRFTVTPSPSIADRDIQIEAVATADGQRISRGLRADRSPRPRGCATCIARRRPTCAASTSTTVPGLKVGYVMGVGDQVPHGIAAARRAGDAARRARAGARPTSSQFDAIMTGTRAYAVREDLKTYNRRLLDYVEGRRQHDRALQHAGAGAEHSSRRIPASCRAAPRKCRRRIRRSTILAPTHQAFNWPNKITKADFDGWVEQRGSKFFTQVGRGVSRR